MSDESQAPESGEPKRGIVRRGQRKPYVRGTKDQVKQRTVEMARALVSGENRWELHRRLCKKWNLDWRTIDIYIGYARDLLKEQAGMTKDQARETGIGVLFKALKSKTLSNNLAAERRLSEIYGYNAPAKTEVTGANGGPLDMLIGPSPLAGLGLSKDELRALAMAAIEKPQLAPPPQPDAEAGKEPAQ